jgi:metal-dependent amidase/aminoacylase/carboxypeptidase family protein
LGCQVAYETWPITPAVVNDMAITQRVGQIAARLLPDCTVDTQTRTMGSEDMAFMMEQVPGCYFFIGSANHSQGLDAPHHHPRFDFAEEALPRAAGLMAAVVADFLR